MLLHELPTPCVLIERRRLQANIEHMAVKAHENEVRLRPHVKTHKSPFIARLQQEAGASGLTCAKPSEAAVFVENGLRDVRLAYPLVTDSQLAQVWRLSNEARISFTVDTLEGARRAGAFFAERGSVADVLVEVDCGYGRCGVRWDDPESPTFVETVLGLSGLNVVGILTHAGHAYGGPSQADESTVDALERIAREERDRMLEFAVRLREKGVLSAFSSALEISIGSTPTMSAFSNRNREEFSITEIRPGNYVFNDAIQVALEAARLDQCSLTVLSSVVSKHRTSSSHERLFLDAGRKVLTSDTGFNTDGYGIMLHSARTMTPLPHAHLIKLNEEHGWADVPGGSTLAVGDMVRIVPNHACVVMNTQKSVFVVNADEVVEEIPVSASQCVT